MNEIWSILKEWLYDIMGGTILVSAMHPVNMNKIHPPTIQDRLKKQQEMQKEHNQSLEHLEKRVNDLTKTQKIKLPNPNNDL